MRTKLTTSSAILLALCTGIGVADAAPVLRVQVEQKGDFVLAGNTIGYECNNPVAPVAGTASCMGSMNNNDTAPDILWRSDEPGNGQASANTGIAVAQARSTAILTVPNDATVTHAYLYWGATLGMAGADATVTLDGPGGFTGDVTAVQSYQASANSYQSLADITPIVQAQGSGAYRVSGIDVVDIVNLSAQVTFGGWWIVVFYERDADPIRNLALFDGFDVVSNGNNQNVTLDGFLAPNPVTDGKLGVITFEGDGTLNGDQLFFSDLVTPLSDALNPADNFFNGTRSTFGAGTHNPGDLPEMPGTARSLAGMDIDIVDIKSRLMPGQTSAEIQATSTQDQYYLAGWVTSIATQRPNFATSNKAAVDVNGGVLLPGDVIEYTIVVTNTGSDSSIDTILTDAIPAGTSFVPNSIQVTAGANAGMKSDASGDDEGEYDSGTNQVIVRLGAGANATQGGAMIVGESTTVTFQVTVEPGASGTISNQASISASGLQGAPNTSTPTDGNGPSGGAPPTDVDVEACLTNSDCIVPLPYCDTAANPNVCVECLVDANCSGLAPTCDSATHACICIPTGIDVCGDLIDNDCSGAIDDECDSDGDGIGDAEEASIGTDPNDVDSDDDGVPDGQEPDYNVDTDGDGLINALDADSDNDGLYDGTELGLDCNGPGTDVGQGHCIADADGGATTTDPLDPDTDNGGVNDGSEDTNKNGTVDPEETDPTTGHGDDDGKNADSDGDGLSDTFETSIGTDPNDADSDDDGVPDGAEANPADDSDGDGLINALDPDSDNDGLYDGTEMGLGCSGAGTDASQNHCIADADGGATVTNPLDPDTDDGGVTDGSEDTNKNGATDTGETDPTIGHGSDDSLNVDTDGDGLTDEFEGIIGTDPNDKDSDDDGVPDGAEANPADDTDGDGTINALDPDSDNDGLFDGTEMGLDCSGTGTDASKNQCIADADGGKTTTSPVDPDTDDGGVSDGAEDTNHNGQVDTGETDPTKGHAADDFSVPHCSQDSECGNATSGQICDSMTQTCVPGCRGVGGNGCLVGQTCSSTDATPGVCSGTPIGSDDGGFSGWGGGILCTTRIDPMGHDNRLAWLFGMGGVATLLMRRRRRSSR